MSERTIRKDCDELNRFLVERGYKPLNLGAGGRIIPGDDLAEAVCNLPGMGFYSYRTSREERVRLACAVLAGAADYLTVADLAERFSVSRASAMNDLDLVRESLSAQGLELEARPNRGLVVHGSELSRRHVLTNFFLESTPVSEQWAASPDRVVVAGDIEVANKILVEQNAAYRVTMDTPSFMRARAYLCVSAERCRGDHRLTAADVAGLAQTSMNDEQPLEPLHEYARDVMRLSSQYMGLTCTNEELAAFIDLLQECNWRPDDALDLEDMQAWGVARELITRASQDIAIDLNDDYALFEFLANHLESMIGLAPAHFPENSMLYEVVSDQPQVLETVRKNLGPIEAYIGRAITETEMNYIALHLCAALERRKNRESPLSVVIMCDGGLGAAQLLAEDLRNRFDVTVTQVVPVNEAGFVNLAGADLVVSTSSLGGRGIEHVVVNLPLDDDDYDVLRDRIQEIRERGPRSSVGGPDDLTAHGLLERVEPVIHACLNEGNYDGLLAKVRTEVRRYFREAQTLERQVISPYLHQLLPAENIQLDVACADWREAIAKSAQPLLESGQVTQGYVDAMIRTTEENGPYVVLAPGLAVPHAAPEDGARRIGMNLIRLAEPVYFGLPEHDPVEFVCALSAVDRRMHLRAFFNLVNMMGSPSSPLTQTLRKVTTSQDAFKAIETYERHNIS